MSENDQNTVVPSVSNENVKRILALLKEGDEKINLGANRDIALVLGNTGAGKSTFTHFIAGNNNNLISTRVGQTSDFIISDTTNKISSNSTIISKTTFPELIFDDETKTAFVDSPGFNDNGRNNAYDIASAYFIKKVFDSVKNVKIILVVSYPSLRKGVNRNDFFQLLEHITILIKNIETYSGSIALVATKVDNSFDFEKEVPVLIPDSSVIENIAQFLQEVKDSLKIMQQQGDQSYTSEFKRTENKLFFEHASNLLDILLQKNGTEYTRLGIFRRPNKPGKLNDIALLQNGKKVLKKIVENLTYSPVDKANIGYTVSDKSKNIIRDLVQEINKNMIDDMAVVNNDLIQNYKQLEERMYSDDMYTLLDQLKTASAALSRVIGIDESSSVQSTINILCENLTTAKATISKSSLRDLSNLNKFLIFMQQISAKKFESFAWKLAKELTGAVRHVDNSLKWYGFLAILHQRLSQYDIQQNIGNYTIPALPIKTENFQVSNSRHFSAFFQQISDINFLKMVNYPELEKVYLDKTKVRYFDLLIEATLKDSLNFITDDNFNRLQVVGEYVKLSQVVQHSYYPRCKSVQIFAKHTIFIDADLIKDNDISIIAPRWHIVGLRKISLDGSHGRPHFDRKAMDGDCAGCHGQDGLPGNPGSSGGHFFGIGDSFVNGDKLTITAKGGDGGFGQHGGDGQKGRDGETYYPSKPYYLDCESNRRCSGVIDYDKSGLFSLNVQAAMQYTYYGTAGGRGGDAGRGGAGGIGGKKGAVTLIGSNDVSILTHNGSDGSFGLHGECAEGGKGGYNIRQHYHFGTWSSANDYRSTEGKAYDGDRGTCIYYSSNINSHLNGLKQPQDKDFLYPPSLALSDFKHHLVGNLHNTIKKHQSLEYYTKFQSNPQLDKLYNATIVLRELQRIDKSYNQFTPETDALLYQSLLTRTIDLAKTADSANENQDCQLLEILQALLTSKLIRLKSRPENNLPLRRDEYFDILSQGNADKIRHYYHDLVDGQMAKTTDFINSFNILHTNDLIERTDDEIVKLSLKDDENDDDELSTVLLKRKLLSSLKYLCEFLALAGSIGRADLSITDRAEIDQVFPSVSFKSEELPIWRYGGINAIANIGNFEDNIGKQIDQILWIISKERKSLKSLGVELDTICNELRNIEMNLLLWKHAAKESFTNRNIIQNALNRFEEANKYYLPFETKTKASDTIRRSQNYVKLLLFDPDMFDEIKSDSSLDHLVSAVDRIRESTIQLENSQNELNDVTAPILKVIHESFTPTGYKPGDVSKIRQSTQEALEKLKITIHQMFNKFELDEDLQSISEFIDESINTLVNEYETLLGQEDRSRLYLLQQYATDRLGSQSIDVRNSLEKSLQNGILLYEYERLVDVFKRYAFPFETTDPSNFRLPAISSFDQNLTTNVRYLKSKLDALKHSNESIVDDYFNSTSTAGPYFTWKNQIYGNTISKLLRGESIVLKATINENGNHEMLKFDSVYLGFYSTNKFIQEFLDKTIKNFNISMTHFGNSYFEFCNRIHLFNSDTTALNYTPDEAFAQMEPILSPYSTWIFRLVPLDSNTTFATFEPFWQQIDLQLEGHGIYINLENKSICEKFESNGMVNDYTSFISKNTDEVNSSPSTRRRRDVSSYETTFSDSFKGKENGSFLKLLNPLSYFVGSDSQYDQTTSPKSLEFTNQQSTTSTSTIQSSFNLNPTLAFLDYVVRNVTKVKPQRAKITSNSSQVRIDVLEIMDKFEAILMELGNRLHIPPSQLELDPVQLMGQLEKAIVKGDPLAIKKVLQNSVTLDGKFQKILDTELIQMLDQTNDNSAQHFSRFKIKAEEQFHNDYVEYAFEDHANGMITSMNENYNASLLDR